MLQPGGIVLLAFHIGQQTVHLDAWWGQTVALDFFFFQVDEIDSYLRDAGFSVEAAIEREPYPDVEHPSRRAYIWAHKSAASDSSATEIGR